jgi:D-hexose-6-phosphate mutarotase
LERAGLGHDYDRTMQTGPGAAGVTLPSSVRHTPGEGGLPGFEIAAAGAAAHVYHHGAHITAWEPADAGGPVLWLSGRSRFQADRPIRGGVPICFPWFGPHRADAGAPAHGFARLMEWTLVDASEALDGAVTLTFALTTEEATSPFWPHRSRVAFRASFGARLDMALEVANHSPEAFTFESALHTYFTVGDVRQISIGGLEGVEYVDKAAGGLRARQEGPVRFSGETDRVYETGGTTLIRDPVLRRSIHVAAGNSGATVVWNPWTAKARALPDFGDEEWRGMVCVETANVGAAAVRLDPGGVHRLTASIGVERS